MCQIRDLVCRVRRSPVTLMMLAGSAAAALTGCQATSNNPSGVSGRYILSLCDADMPATAFADNQLGPRTDDKDMMTIIGLPIADGKDPKYETPFAQLSVSNSVIGPPQAVAVTMDGKWAYVIENHGAAPDGATSTDQLPVGRSLTRIDLTNPLKPVEAGKLTVGTEPMAVDVNAAGDLVAVVSREKRKQIELISISAGGMGDALNWPMIGADDDENTVPSCVSWHPSGDFLAITVPSMNQVYFYRVNRGAGSLSIAPWGQPVTVGKYPYSGKFTPDGRFYITSDMQWGEDVNGFFVEPPQGTLSVVKFDHVGKGIVDPAKATLHEVVCSTPVGVNPEGLAISHDGTMVVTANLLHSFLPDSDARLTKGGSLSLLKLDPATGMLSPVEEYPINSMPVGLSFDAKGEHVVVTQFRSFDPNVKTGELAFFAVKSGSRPSLTQSDFFVGVGKGPHGVLIVR